MQHRQRLVGAPDRDVRRPHAELQVGIVGRLGQRAVELLDRLLHVPRLLEQQAALEREARVVLVDGGDLVELPRRLVELAHPAERHAETEVGGRVPRVGRERRVEVGDRAVVVALQLADLAERALERRRRRELLLRLVERGAPLRHLPPLRQQLRERHVRQHRVGPGRIDERDRRAQVGLGRVAVAEVLLDLSEQDEHRDALRELLAGGDELLLRVGEPLEGDLRLRVVRDRLGRVRVDAERRVEARQRLGGALLVEEEPPLPVERVDVARIERDGLREGLARVGRAAALEADPRLRGVRDRQLPGRRLRARRAVEHDREIGERLDRIGQRPSSGARGA